MTIAPRGTKPVPTIPEGYGTVTPWIIGRDTAGLLAFLKQAFDAEELARVPSGEGKIGHAETRIGDSIIMMFDGPDHWPATPGFMRLYVPDGEATYQQALRAGAASVTEMTHLFFGDLVGRVRDPFGNVWWIHEHIEDVDEAEAMRRLQDPEFIKAMEYVQGAEIVPARS